MLPPTMYAGRTSANGIHPTQGVSHRFDRRSSDVPTFTAADLGNFGYVWRMTLATVLIGIGTTGSLCVNALVSLILAERRRHWPESCEYLLLDAAAPQPCFDIVRFFRLAGGVDGAGTDPHIGRELFQTPENYRQLRHALNAMVLGIMQSTAEPPAVSPRQAMNLVVVGNNGGTSGGVLDPMIAMIHDVAQERRIEQPRIHVVQIGPEIAIRDKDRQVCVEQQHVIRATAAANLGKLLQDMASDGLVQENRPDGTKFTIPAGQRVQAVAFADQSNGESDCATVAELIQMLSHALYLRFFTQAGAYLDERFRDLDRLGVLGRGQLNS